jgi:integrase
MGEKPAVNQQARVTAGTPEAHLHDLRHLSGTLAATTGATVKDLMARLGHSCTRAALIYRSIGHVMGSAGLVGEQVADVGGNVRCRSD